jgi:hypothetical protein
MPPLAPADHMFTKVHSKLTRAELVELAAALGLEVKERANVQHLKAITRQKLKDDLPRYIRHLSFKQLFSKRDHQNYKREYLIGEDHKEWEGFREPGPGDLVSHQSGDNHAHQRVCKKMPAIIGPIRSRN